MSEREPLVESNGMAPYFVDAETQADRQGIRIAGPRRQRPPETADSDPPVASVPRNILRAYDAAIDSVDKADRSLVARINTSGRDRYNTVIDPRGGKLENYRKNPAVLWEHGKDPRRFTDPIGRNLWVKHNGGSRPTELLARTKFLDDDFSQQRFEWYRDGVLNAFSVNILPVHERCGPPTGDELRAVPEWGGADAIYREWDLAEYSGTTIPGNADCLVSERAAKMLDLVARNLLWLPDDVRPLVEERAHSAPDTPAEPEPGPTPEFEIDGKSIVAIAREFADERRAMKQSLRDEIRATLDLVFYGRV